LPFIMTGKLLVSMSII